MIVRPVKCLLVAAFSLFCLVSSGQGKETGQEQIHPEEGRGQAAEPKKNFDANEVIFGHVLDAHQFHFLTYNGSDGQKHHVGINLPVLLYSQQRGFEAFSSGNFHHGETTYKNYLLVTPEYKEYLLKNHVYTEEELKGFRNESIIAVDSNGLPSKEVKVYDFSLTRNVVQMMLALAVLVWLLLSIAKRYNRGEGVNTAPTGWQNAIEPIITFVRDDVAKPNLGHKYRKYMPYLLTIFFFILINNIFGLIPGSANVTG